MPRAPFITFEGGEGAGKTTQIRAVSEALQERGIPVLTTREPGGTPTAEALRAFLLSDLWEGDEMTETLLFLAARRDHWRQVIEPALTAGTWVLCDRFSDSTLVYQGIVGSLGVDKVTELTRLAVGEKAEPDLTFVLSVPWEVANGRITLRSEERNRYDARSASWHRRLQEGFAELCRIYPKRCIPVDASASVDAVTARLLEILEEQLPAVQKEKVAP